MMMPTPMRAKSAKIAVLFMFVGGMTPAPGLARVLRGRRFCVRAARRRAFGEREGVVGEGWGVRRSKFVNEERSEVSGTGAMIVDFVIVRIVDGLC